MTRTYWLMGIDGITRKIKLPIKGPLLIGRGSYNHVVLKDPRISRQHARIALETDGCVVYDLGTTNGTFVNGTPVSRHPLRLHDEVSFGSLAFRITAGSQDARTDDSADLETPTLRDVGSVSRMLAAGPPSSRDSSAQLPVVDLGQLEDAYDKLGTLYSFLQTISQTIDSTELLALIGAKTREIYQSSNGVGIYLLARDNGSSAFKLVHFVGDPSAEPAPVSLPDEISRAILGSPKGVLAAPTPGRTTGGTRMYAPMIDQSETVGVIHVAADPRTGGFTRADIDLLSGMAAPAAMMLKNAKNQQESRQREHLRHDLELAAQIQKSFLPREVLSVEGVELFAEYRAAYSVGGDFYDVFWVAPDRLGVFIGDISGKGVAGALLMARISSEMRVAALAKIEPVQVLSAMNKALIARNQPDLFYTAVYLTLDVKTGDVVLANAGHPPPYCARSNGTLEEITEGAAAPVGIVDDPQFEATLLRLGHGDSLVLYTDGVVEATSASGTLYGSNRLEQVLAQSDPRPHAIAERILASVSEHLGDVPANDDLTLLICQRNIGRPPSLQPRRRSGMLKRTEL
ncbi:MAG TPA: SpoIIE family protein phosphatase [Polyangiaceae bacterium]|jgi:serine phosphatase RsbU (regulator of sigma subunit)/pSer/pThr/pTyr-binding forkhead associated (FHA) protein